MHHEIGDTNEIEDPVNDTTVTVEVIDVYQDDESDAQIVREVST